MTNPIAIAVEPLRSVAVERAEAETRALIKRMFAKLEECGWDRNTAYPYPQANNPLFHRAKAAYDLASHITQPDPTVRADYTMRGPKIVIACPSGVDRLIEEAREQAEAMFEAYVAKLTSKAAKLGDTVEARLTAGDYLWSYSILDVAYADGTHARFKTQMIINFSKYGLPFNQWPTRQMKLKAA